MTPTGCGRGAGGGDGGGGAVRGVCESMTVMKKRMISPMTAPRTEKKWRRTGTMIWMRMLRDCDVACAHHSRCRWTPRGRAGGGNVWRRGVAGVGIGRRGDLTVWLRRRCVPDGRWCPFELVGGERRRW